MLLENIWRRVVGNILMNISPSNISWNMLLAKLFHQNYQAVLAAVSINGLILQQLCVCMQGFSQDLETGCLKLAVVKFLGVQIIKGDHNILIFQP